MIPWLLTLFTKEYAPRQAMLIVCLSSALWGVLWVPMRYLEAAGLTGLWVVVLFHLLPTLTMLPFMGGMRTLSRQDWAKICLAGVLMGAGFALYAVGLVLASVTKTVVLFYMTPIWSTIIGYFVLGERAGAARWIAIMAALAGCAMISGVTDMIFVLDPLDSFGLLSGLFWAMGSVAIRRFDGVNFTHVTFLQYLFGGILALIAAVLLVVPVPDIAVWMDTIPLAFVASAMIFLPTVLLLFRIMQYISPGLVGILMLSEALVAALSAAYFLGERLDPAQWLGAGLILATGVFVGIIEGRRSPSDKLAL